MTLPFNHFWYDLLVFYLCFTTVLVQNVLTKFVQIFEHITSSKHLWNLRHHIELSLMLKSFVRSLKTACLYVTKTLARNIGQWPRNTKFTDLARNFNQWLKSFVRSLKTVYLYFTKTLARNFGQWPRNTKSELEGGPTPLDSHLKHLNKWSPDRKKTSYIKWWH